LVLPKSNHICPNLNYFFPKFVQIMLKFAQKNFLRDTAASASPTALKTVRVCYRGDIYHEHQCSPFQYGDVFSTLCRSVERNGGTTFRRSPIISSNLIVSPLTYVPYPLAPIIAKIRHTLFGDELFLTTFLLDSFGFLGGTGPSRSYPLWTVRTSLPRSQPSLVLSPMQDKTEEEFVLQRLRTLSARSNLPPRLSRIWASPVRHLWHYFFHFWPLVQTLGRGPTVESPWSSSTPPSLRRGRVAPQPLQLYERNLVSKIPFQNISNQRLYSIHKFCVKPTATCRMYYAWFAFHNHSCQKQAVLTVKNDDGGYEHY